MKAHRNEKSGQISRGGARFCGKSHQNAHNTTKNRENACATSIKRKKVEKKLKKGIDKVV